VPAVLAGLKVSVYFLGPHTKAIKLLSALKVELISSSWKLKRNVTAVPLPTSVPNLTEVLSSATFEDESKV
jgi:hypothetical protein